MSVLTSAEMVDFVISAKNMGWGYVYSGQGELYTPALAQEWGSEARAGKSYDYYVNQCSRWFGKNVVDCSGLIVQGFRSKYANYQDQTSGTLYSQCNKKGAIASIPETPGLCVWRSGHIGLYIGSGNVVESAGTNIGVVISALAAPASGKAWTNWGMLADADYSLTPTPPVTPAPPSVWVGKIYKLTSPYMSDENIARIQKILLSVGCYSGKIDGVYGPLTQKAVICFQTKVHLVADGIIGKLTAAALDAAWVEDYQGQLYDPSQEAPLNSFTLARQLKFTFPLMHGSDVRDVQNALLLRSFSPGISDGYFGVFTRSAVMSFQKQAGLKADGVVGKQTVSALGGVWAGN
jgi:peptidoglycan hydrolase-like protein with peptidoglycan-binding domain